MEKGQKSNNEVFLMLQSKIHVVAITIRNFLAFLKICVGGNGNLTIKFAWPNHITSYTRSTLRSIANVWWSPINL